MKLVSLYVLAGTAISFGLTVFVNESSGHDGIQDGHSHASCAGGSCSHAPVQSAQSNRSPYGRNVSSYSNGIHHGNHAGGCSCGDSHTSNANPGQFGSTSDRDFRNDQGFRQAPVYNSEMYPGYERTPYSQQVPSVARQYGYGNQPRFTGNAYRNYPNSAQYRSNIQQSPQHYRNSPADEQPSLNPSSFGPQNNAYGRQTTERRYPYQ